MCESSCKPRSCVCISLFVGAIFAIAAGLSLVFCPWLCVAPVIKTMLFFSAIIFLVLVLVILSGERSKEKRPCICNCGKFLLMTAIATMVLAIISSLVPFTFCIFNIIMFALIVFAFVALVTGFIILLFCYLDNLCDCHHSRPDHCHSNHSENSRYNNHTNDYMN